MTLAAILKMEKIDIFWLLAFILLFMALNVLVHIIVNSLKDKPLGSQSIYDVALQDTFFVMKCYGSFICLMQGFANITKFRATLVENDIALTLACSIYSFGYTAIGISTGCLCFIRIFCLINLSFVEESIGEYSIRMISTIITVGISCIVVFILFINEETNSGAFASLLTLKPTPSGKTSLYPYPNILVWELCGW